MSQNKSEFHPVVPNITDDTMRTAEIDPDVKSINTRTKKKKNQEDDKPIDANNDNSIGRTVLIGVLIVIIIVLLVLLIYQVYKYCTADTTVQLPTLTDTQKNNIVMSKATPSPVSTQKLPESVKNLDDSVLRQYIKKTDSSTGKKSLKSVHFDNMLKDKTPTNEKPENDTNDEQIVADILEDMDNNKDIPTREDMTEILREEKKNDDGESCLMEFEDEKHTFGDDSDSLPELEPFGEEGCAFKLIRGARTGQLCNAKTVEGDRCTRHRNK